MADDEERRADDREDDEERDREVEPVEDERQPWAKTSSGDADSVTDSE
jgi:hypothetical protein